MILLLQFFLHDSMFYHDFVDSTVILLHMILLFCDFSAAILIPLQQRNICRRFASLPQICVASDVTMKTCK
jgi:hypothetical protein